MRYALLDASDTLLRHQEFDAPPPDPVGKAWHWMEDPLPDPPAPTPVVPGEVTNFQARAALLSAGLLGAVESFIAGLADPLATAAWEYSGVVARDSALVAAVQLALELSDAALDALFIAAAAISA